MSATAPEVLFIAKIVRRMGPAAIARVRAAHDQTKAYDFYSRYFWPWAGTNEDPVTGGTHTFLAPYWAKKLGKRKMKSFQCSRRSGFMEVEIKGEDLCIRSQAVIVFAGEIRV